MEGFTTEAIEIATMKAKRDLAYNLELVYEAAYKGKGEKNFDNFLKNLFERNLAFCESCKFEKLYDSRHYIKEYEETKKVISIVKRRAKKYLKKF